MKNQCFYDEALKSLYEYWPFLVMDEKEKTSILKVKSEVKLLIKKYKKREKKMFTGALGE